MRRNRHSLKNTQRTKNMQLKGAGAGTSRDRGALQSSAEFSLNPYYNNNFIGRWQEFVRWYNTSWEARKIINIPVEDALRIPVTLKGLSKEAAKTLKEKAEELNLDRQLKRALIQERLLGGSVILGLFDRPIDEKIEDRLKYETIEKGDLKALNVVDISRVSRPNFDTDIFSVDYDKVINLTLQGVTVHESRLCIFDGDALFNRSSQQVLQNFRFNPTGFGESKLTPLYDILVRVSGTQQGAYHLVNLASCLVMAVPELRSFEATDNLVYDELRKVVDQISIYNAAIVEAEGVEFKNQVSSFGSVPELVMSFLQILSAGCDIPATRFLGQAPGGLNTSGAGDLENYYNNIASWQQQTLKPMQMRLYTWIGYSTFGAEWETIGKDLELEYESLWNLDEVQMSQVRNTYVEVIKGLYDAGLISKKQAVQELKKRDIFETEIDIEEALSAEAQTIVDDPFGGAFNADIITAEPQGEEI